jgi:hypothetical protein
MVGADPVCHDLGVTIRTVSDDAPFYTPGLQLPPRQPKRGELLFEFVRASNRALISCELRFHGESYGWEVVFLERGELFYSHGAFITKGLAVQWAEVERKAMEAPGRILHRHEHEACLLSFRATPFSPTPR